MGRMLPPTIHMTHRTSFQPANRHSPKYHCSDSSSNSGIRKGMSQASRQLYFRTPHPGSGFPAFTGIFEFAIQYFAFERCFPLAAGRSLHFKLISSEFLRFERSVEEGGTVGRTFNNLQFARDYGTCKSASDLPCLRCHW